VTSPLRAGKVELGKVPLILAADKFVSADPSATGKVAGKTAEGKVPDARFEAFRLVRLAPLRAGKAPFSCPAERFVKADPSATGKVAGKTEDGKVPKSDGKRLSWSVKLR